MCENLSKSDQQRYPLNCIAFCLDSNQTRIFASTAFCATLSPQATFCTGRFLPQPLKKSFDIASVLKTSKKMIIFFRFKASYVLILE